MSVRSEIDRISQNIANTYSKLEAFECDMPSERNSDNLPGYVDSVVNEYITEVAQLIGGDM